MPEQQESMDDQRKRNLEFVLKFLDGEHDDRTQTRKLVRAAFFQNSLGVDATNNPVNRVLVTALTNAIQPLFTGDAEKERRINELVTLIKKGNVESRLAHILDELRSIFSWLRAQVKTASKTEPTDNEQKANPRALKRIYTQLIDTITTLAGGSQGLKNTAQALAQRLEEIDSTGFQNDLRQYCHTALDTGRTMQEQQEQQRRAFLDLVSAMMIRIQQVRNKTGGASHQITSSLARLKKSVSLEDLQEIRSILISEAEGLKNHTKKMQSQLDESQAQLRETQQKLRKLESELERTRSDSLTDPLTGLTNRRALDEALGKELARSTRHNLNLSLILFDLDHFKKVNDTYGHQVGDKVLKAVADKATEMVRQTDTLCRFGGEEFALLLPETDLAAAVMTAEKIRKGVQSLRFRVQGTYLAVTSSFGVTSLRRAREIQPQEGEDERISLDERLIYLADMALYSSKKKGRNCVTSTGEAA